MKRSFEYRATLLLSISLTICAAARPFDKHGNDTRSDKIKLEDKIALSVNPLGRGHLIVAPSVELPPGEYGLLLHPKKSEYSGTANVNGDAIFFSVWDFSLNPGLMASAGKNQGKTNQLSIRAQSRAEAVARRFSRGLLPTRRSDAL